MNIRVFTQDNISKLDRYLHYLFSKDIHYTVHVQPDSIDSATNKVLSTKVVVAF